MITAHEVLTALIDDPTESGLGDFLATHHASEAVTWIPDPLDNLHAIGHALVVTDNGLLAIPYTAVFLGNGWEQLELNEAILIPTPASYTQAAQRYTQAEHELTQLLRNGIDQARPVTL